MPAIVSKKASGVSAASNGNGALQRCASLANGALRPDQRVNYEFGLVLGVDDFRQEQLYFLEKDYLHNRGLHGFGTVFGLEVTAGRPADSSDEMLITVSPGMGIDQFGRPIVIREEQCARLGAWYAKQVQNGAAPPADEAGVQRCYVVAGYDECLDALVPIPGQPCSSSESTMAPSRIRDAFTLELRWDAPHMAAWNAVRAFADLLNGVRFVPGLAEADSDEDEIIALVRTLTQPPAFDPCAQASAGPVASPPVTLQLPLETAREALDRVFTVWVTEVRPTIQGQADLIDPGSDTDVEAGILLACIDFTPAAAFDVNAPKIDAATVDDGGRPFLLHTQLIQELLLLGGQQQEAAKELHEFATLQVHGSHELWAWLHHPAALEFVGDPAAALALRANGQELKLDKVEPLAGFDNVAVITTAAAVAHELEPAARLELTVDLTALREVGGAGLLDVLAAAAYDYVGRDGDKLTVYGAVERILPSRDLVTVRAERTEAGVELVLWFHTDAPVRLPKTIPVTLGQGGLTVPFEAQPAEEDGRLAYRWRLATSADVALTPGMGLLLAFDTRTIAVGKARTTLADVIEADHLSFLGFDGRQTIWVYYEIELPQEVVIPPPPPVEIPWDEVFVRIALQLPTQPFVTITPILVNSDQTLIELWFHVDRRFSDAEAVVFMDDQKPPTFHVFSERSNMLAGRSNPAGDVTQPPKLIEIPQDRMLVNAVQSNVYQLTIFSDAWKEFGSDYLRFAFPFDATRLLIGGGDVPLADYIKETRIKFEGHNGEDAIVAFCRVTGAGGIG